RRGVRDREGAAGRVQLDRLRAAAAADRRRARQVEAEGDMKRRADVHREGAARACADQRVRDARQSAVAEDRAEIQVERLRDLGAGAEIEVEIDLAVVPFDDLILWRTARQLARVDAEGRLR